MGASVREQRAAPGSGEVDHVPRRQSDAGATQGHVQHGGRGFLAGGSNLEYIYLKQKHNQFSTLSGLHTTRQLGLSGHMLLHRLRK